MGKLLLVRSISLIALLGLSIPTGARADEDKEVKWGMDAKVRRWRVSKRLQKVFISDSPGPAGDYGGGVDFVRRLGDTEILFGFGYDSLSLKNGYYLDKNTDPTVLGNVDFTTFNNFEWYTVEATAVKVIEIHKILELRLGVGVGLGWIRGYIEQTDAECTGNQIQTQCSHPAPGAVPEKTDVPPVLPVLNMLAGIQLKPFRFLHLHAEAGIHTTPYIGAGATFYLW